MDLLGSDDEDFHDVRSNMHVELGAARRSWLADRGLPAELTDSELARMKPGHRAVLASRLEAIWAACEPYIDAGSSGADLRMVELALKCVDRLARLYEVNVADRVEKGDVPELEAASARRAAVLADLEARRGFLEG